ncbi:MAG: hypothetical protein OXC06_15345 [Acidimicrobiaceae bacterium]|nr:hypothetical protein [Acidimicrobiaceae bacterium]
MTAPTPGSLLLKEGDGAVRPRLDPAGPRDNTGSGLPATPRGGDRAHRDDSDTTLDTALMPDGPSTRRAVPAGPVARLGPLGWLAVLLIAALVTVLAHAGSVRSDQMGHREPSLGVDPAYVLAKHAENTPP